jgi:hypothetical protein
MAFAACQMKIPLLNLNEDSCLELETYLLLKEISAQPTIFSFEKTAKAVDTL